METDYDTTRKGILDACNAAGICYEVNPRNEGRTDADELKDAPLKFHVWLTVNRPGQHPVALDTPYTAGVGIADHATLDSTFATEYTRRIARSARGNARNGEHRTVNGVRVLREARARYRPTVVDVVSSLFLDAGYAADHDTWEDMAAESGAPLKTAEDLRQAQRTFVACKEAGRFLRRVFGTNYEAVAALCGEL